MPHRNLRAKQLRSTQLCSPTPNPEMALSNSNANTNATNALLSTIQHGPQKSSLGMTRSNMLSRTLNADGSQRSRGKSRSSVGLATMLSPHKLRASGQGKPMNVNIRAALDRHNRMTTMSLALSTKLNPVHAVSRTHNYSQAGFLRKPVRTRYEMLSSHQNKPSAATVAVTRRVEVPGLMKSSTDGAFSPAACD